MKNKMLAPLAVPRPVFPYVRLAYRLSNRTRDFGYLIRSDVYRKIYPIEIDYRPDKKHQCFGRSEENWRIRPTQFMKQNSLDGPTLIIREARIYDSGGQCVLEPAPYFRYVTSKIILSVTGGLCGGPASVRRK